MSLPSTLSRQSYWNWWWSVMTFFPRLWNLLRRATEDMGPVASSLGPDEPTRDFARPGPAAVRLPPALLPAHHDCPTDSRFLFSQRWELCLCWILWLDELELCQTYQLLSSGWTLILKISRFRPGTYYSSFDLCCTYQ